MHPTISRRRSAGAAALGLALGIGVAVVGAVPAGADDGFEFRRIGGDDRYQTSALVADEYGASDAVILANGAPDNYADALTATYLAGVKDAPILLTRHGSTPASVLAQLEDTDPDTVYLVGGEAVISAAQAQALSAAGYTVERISGASRFDTNAAVIEAGGAASGDLALVATGFAFADALAGGPLAYQGLPLALSDHDSVDRDVLAALQAAGVDRVLVLGGESAVGQGVVDDLATAGITVAERFDGLDRSATSVQFADYVIDNFGFTDAAVNVASGSVAGDGADALAGGPLTGQQERPLLITRDVDSPDDDVLGFLDDHAATLTRGIIFGGSAAIADGAEAEMRESARSVEEPEPEPEPEPTQVFTITPGDTATVTDTQNDERQYAVSNPVAETDHTIVLVPADSVATDGEGVVSFTDADGDGHADGGSVQSQVATVNGSATTGTPVVVRPSEEVITFTVEGEGDEEVVPVVFVDVDGDGALDVGADAVPTEQFGIGGSLIVQPPKSGGDVTPPSPVDHAPYIVEATVVHDGDAPPELMRREVTAPAPDNIANPGDQWRLSMSEPVTLTDVAWIDLSDEAGTEVRVYCANTLEGKEGDLSFPAETTLYGAECTFAGESPSQGEVLELTLISPVVKVAGPVGETGLSGSAALGGGSETLGLGVPGFPEGVVLAEPVAYPLTVTSTERVTGLNGKPVSIGDSEDVVLEFEPPIITSSKVIRDADDDGNSENPDNIANAGQPGDSDPEGVYNDGDRWGFTASEPITGTAGGDAVIHLEDADGTAIRVVCVGDGWGDLWPESDRSDAATYAGCVFPGESSSQGDQLEVTLLTDAVDSDGLGGIRYPLTVTGVENAVDLDGISIDIERSDDLVLETVEGYDPAVASLTSHVIADPDGNVSVGTNTNDEAGYNDGDSWVFGFDEPVKPTGPDNTVIHVDDGSGKAFDVECIGDGWGDVPADAQDGVIYAGCVFTAGDATTPNQGTELTVTVVQIGADTSPQDVAYPLTVTSVEGASDLSGNPIDAAGLVIPPAA